MENWLKIRLTFKMYRAIQCFLAIVLLVCLFSCGRKKSPAVQLTAGSFWSFPDSSYSHVDDSICILSRNANNASREMAIIIPVGNEGIFVPFGKPWTNNGSGAPEIGQAYYQVQLLGGMQARHGIRSGSWTWVDDPSKYGFGYLNGTSGSILFKTGKASTRIGVYDMPVSASGMMLVEIDGNKSLANHLPQVSELITIGTLSSSVLIAQGGTLNPTDRIYYQKSTAGTSIADPHSSGFDNLLCQNRKVRIASNLQPGEHTIRFIHTGYSAMGQENKNFRISGIWFDDPSTRMGYPGVGFEFKDIQDIHCPESDNNFAFRYRPEGATSMDDYEWLGHQNGTQLKSDDCTLTLDGIVQTDLPMGMLRKAHEMILEVPGKLKHPLEPNHSAIYSQVFIVRPQEGITCQTRIQWKKAGHITTGYIPQLAVFEPMNRATVLEANQNYTLNENNDVNRYNRFGTAGYIWSTQSNWAILLSTSQMDTIWLADRSDGYNKIYFRHYSNQTIQVGDTLNLSYKYEFKKFANAELSLGK
jgi:hypothetical protein